MENSIIISIYNDFKHPLVYMATNTTRMQKTKINTLNTLNLICGVKLSFEIRKNFGSLNKFGLRKAFIPPYLQFLNGGIFNNICIFPDFKQNSLIFPGLFRVKLCSSGFQARWPPCFCFSTFKIKLKMN